MSEHVLDFDAELSRLDPEAWAARLEEIADEHGYFEPLGARHSAAFLDAGPKLLVTFEDARTIRNSRPASEPRGFDFVRNEGWSSLSLISEGESWYREKRIYGYFDRLVDDGFFEDFQKVVFHGAHAAAYAACTFSVCAPGATVIALRPQATLDPRIAGFDTRHMGARRLDFHSRYGYAPDMIEAAQEAFILFDPLQRIDAMHAALFRRENVTAMRCTGLGRRIDTMLDATGLHNELIRQAMDGSLDEQSFARMLRQRRTYAPFLRNLVNRAIAQGHMEMAAKACSAVLRERDDAFFSDKLDELAAEGFGRDGPGAASAAE